MPHNMENPLNREYSKPVDPAGIPQKAKTARAVTSRDVAREAGVSQSLVSLVLSNKAGKKIRPQTRAHVLAVARELGYRPNLQARAMKLRKARAIGLLSTWDTGSFVFPPVVNGLKEICDREGMALTLCTGRADTGGVPDYVAYYLENRIDGLVYLSHVGVTSEGTIARLMESRIPFVCAIGARDLQGVSSVDVDFLHNGRLAAEHLLATVAGTRCCMFRNPPITLNGSGAPALQRPLTQGACRCGVWMPERPHGPECACGHTAGAASGVSADGRLLCLHPYRLAHAQGGCVGGLARSPSPASHLHGQRFLCALSHAVAQYGGRAPGGYRPGGRRHAAGADGRYGTW